MRFFDEVAGEMVYLPRGWTVENGNVVPIKFWVTGPHGRWKRTGARRSSYGSLKAAAKAAGFEKLPFTD